ncbi:MAG TPA: filamentous hemagglutinin N-terminal domain-containing protein, partial [Gammaproteobacteria bacterium]|nr:filamentous hemagglutinin N-terminal domain-containing protein [Gammaproteobacteria bacterium]
MVANISTILARKIILRIKLPLFSLSFLLCWGTLYSPCVLPEVVPDGVSATTVTTTINGVPVVGIVAPTTGGVSHNTFSTFDVGLPGVIINNSRFDGISALPGAGSVNANTNLGTTSARIILNEVTGTGRSNLLGTTEIFGDNASYIVANPNGITCNGCGFIRTPTALGDSGNLREVILSTSDVLTLSGGGVDDLNSLSIARNSLADIIIGPGGLDISNVDITTLLTRKLNVKGLISAANNRLQMILGTGTLNFDSAQPENRTFNATQSDDNTVTVAIDASTLGAMNAGQIYIMATEDGVGVTLDNDLIASAGNVELTANGDIIYRNLQASNAIDVTTQGVGVAGQASALTVHGNTVASNAINWNLAGDAAIDTGSAASINAGNSIDMNCTGTNCALNSQDDLTLDAALLTGNTDLNTNAGKDLAINADVTTGANIQSGGSLAISATGQVITGDLTAAVAIQVTADTLRTTTINARSGGITLDASTVNSGDIQSSGILTITTTGNTIAANIDADTAVSINAASLTTGNIQSGKTVSLTTTGNTDTADISVVNNISLDADNLTTGNIQSSGLFNIDASSGIDINATTLVAGTIHSGDTLAINTTDTTDTVDITAVADIVIDVLSLDSGNIQTNSTLLATTTNTLSTLNIDAQSDIALSASGINAGDINSGNILSLSAVNGDITATSLNASDTIIINTQASNSNLLTNSISSGNDVNWQLSGQAQLGGNISATQAINFTCNTPGCSVNASNALRLDAQNLNTQADIQTSNNQNLSINANVASSADISSANRLQITASNGDITSSGSLSAAQNIELSSAAGGNISISGAITTGNDFVVKGAGNYDHNNNANLNVAGDWIIDIHSLTNNDKLVATDLQNNVFRVDEFTNNGLFQSDGPLTVQVDEQLNNNGVIASLEGVININHSQNEGKTGTINNNGIIAAINLSEQQQPENTLIIDPQSFIDDYVADILAGKQRTSQDLVNTINVTNQQTLSQLTAGTGERGSIKINAEVLNNNEAATLSATQIAMNITAINNQGGLITASENMAIKGDTVNNSNTDTLFGVITARDSIDFALDKKFDNEGVIESVDIVIDAPIQNNNSSELVLGGLTGKTISTVANIDATASQLWFSTAQNNGFSYQYSKADDNNPLINSNLTQLTDAFLGASGTGTSALPIVGDDLFLAQLVTDTLRTTGDIPFVTNDRNNLLQLSTLYNNTLVYMNEENLNFGQRPSETQRQTLTAPIIVFERQTRVDGQQVLAPTIVLPDGEQNTNALAADQFSSRIIAHNNLLLKSEHITNSGDLIAGNNLVIDTIDLSLTTTSRNWFVTDEGEVKYRSAMISAPSMAITVSGNYVQKGGQLITDTPLIIDAENIDIAGIDVQAQGVKRRATAKLESQDALYLLAKQRLTIGSNARTNSQGDSILTARQALTIQGDVHSGGDLSLMANQIQVAGNSKQSPATLQAQGNLLMQSESSIDLSYVDITASRAANDVLITDENKPSTGSIV